MATIRHNCGKEQKNLIIIAVNKNLPINWDYTTLLPWIFTLLFLE
jgi:hypothetical protein